MTIHIEDTTALFDIAIRTTGITITEDTKITVMPVEGITIVREAEPIIEMVELLSTGITIQTEEIRR
jgi:hypothetical protein